MLPTEIELLSYIERVKFVNHTKIAKRFEVSKHIIPDLLVPLLKKGKIRVKQIGSNKFVEAIRKK